MKFFEFIQLTLRFVITVSFMLGSFAVADGSHPLLTSEEKEIKLKAKKRIYPGGKDEEPLKVQAQLPQAVRKIGATEDAANESSADD